MGRRPDFMIMESGAFVYGLQIEVDAMECKRLGRELGLPRLCLCHEAKSAVQVNTTCACVSRHNLCVVVKVSLENFDMIQRMASLH